MVNSRLTCYETARPLFFFELGFFRFAKEISVEDGDMKKNPGCETCKFRPTFCRKFSFMNNHCCLAYSTGFCVVDGNKYLFVTNYFV